MLKWQFHHCCKALVWLQIPFFSPISGIVETSACCRQQSSPKLHFHVLLKVCLFDIFYRDYILYLLSKWNDGTWLLNDTEWQISCLMAFIRRRGLLKVVLLSRANLEWLFLTDWCNSCIMFVVQLLLMLWKSFPFPGSNWEQLFWRICMFTMVCDSLVWHQTQEITYCISQQ